MKALARVVTLAVAFQCGTMSGSAVGQESQQPKISLAGVLFDSTSMAPLAGAAIYLKETSFASATDREGRWGIPGVPPGSYEVSVMHGRIAELGYQTPPVWRVDVSGEAATVVRLSLPSWATLVEAVCGAEGPSGGFATATGVVEDGETGMPLPGATVEFTWAAGGKEVTVDGEGRYWACGLPVDRTIVGRASFYGSTTAGSRLYVPDNGVGEARFGFEFDIADESLPVDIRGTVTDQVSEEPIRDASIRLEGAAVHRIASDSEGRFQLEGIEPGAYLVQVEHIGYGTHTEAVVVEGGGMFELDVGLAVGAVELPGIVVTARSARERERLSRGSLVGYISREKIAVREMEARHVGDLIRGNITALSVREEPGFGGLCVESRRERAQYPDCNMVLVYIDDVLINEPGSYITSLSPTQIENVEFVPSSLAGARYGTGARFGVLLIETRRP